MIDMATAAQKIATQLKTLRALMDKEDELTARLKPIKDQIESLRDTLINEFTAAELSSTTASGLRVTRTQSTVPNLIDPLEFFKFASKKANWDLLTKKVATEAWRERLEAKKPVPGTEAFNRVGISVTRIKEKK
jgi:hypothetical protein